MILVAKYLGGIKLSSDPRNINSSSDPIKSAFAPLSNWADILYRFTMVYSDYIGSRHDYSFCDLSSMVDLHTLTAISDNPGKTISELAVMWHRTDGAISQTVSRLEKKGYVVRRKKDGNGKCVYVYATEEGDRVSATHKMYDSTEVSNTIRELCTTCTTEEVAAFFKVAEAYIHLFENS